MSKCLANFYLSSLYKKYECFKKGLECYLSPLWLLVARLWMAKVFFYSGLAKIDSWQATVYLFTDMYKVPLLSPEFSAYSATAIELVCPVLLVLGIFSRFAVIPMLVMTAIIEMNMDSAADTITHFYWTMLLTSIMIFGPGKISLDCLAKRCCNK